MLRMLAVTRLTLLRQAHPFCPKPYATTLQPQLHYTRTLVQAH